MASLRKRRNKKEGLSEVGSSRLILRRRRTKVTKKKVLDNSKLWRDVAGMKADCDFCKCGNCPIHGAKTKQLSLAESVKTMKDSNRSLLDWLGNAPSPVQVLVENKARTEIAADSSVQEKEVKEEQSSVSLVRQPMKQPKVAAKISLSVSVSLEDLTAAISGLNRDEKIQFVKRLDSSVSDWDFTLKLYRHFAKLKKQYDEESKKLKEAEEPKAKASE